MNAPAEIEIIRPDDWHLHLRDGPVLAAVLPHTSSVFARAIVMPNLVPPARTAEEVDGYRRRILDCLPDGHRFEPLMTCYLTDTTDAASVRSGFAAAAFVAAKLYPAGATTNSENGVTRVERIAPVLEVMEEIGMPLLVHGEVTESSVDIFDREAVFIEQVLEPVRQRFPALRVVMEHVTTAEAVDYIRSAQTGLAATITVHHLIINRNAIFDGGVRPHYYCLPIAKREHHRLALREAAVSGDRRFFLGTDSAPHTRAAKESACGCAGLFTAVNALGCLAHVFEDEGRLERLEAFTSVNGPAFYGRPPNDATIRLVKRTLPVSCPLEIPTDEGPIAVFDPGFPVHWCVAD